jgi:hypothetical protein
MDAASLGLAIRDCKERGFALCLRTVTWKIARILWISNFASPESPPVFSPLNVDYDRP